MVHCCTGMLSCSPRPLAEIPHHGSPGAPTVPGRHLHTCLPEACARSNLLDDSEQQSPQVRINSWYVSFQLLAPPRGSDLMARLPWRLWQLQEGISIIPASPKRTRPVQSCQCFRVIESNHSESTRNSRHIHTEAQFVMKAAVINLVMISRLRL